ncbi:hypothetical protein ACV3J7_23340 [Salmonella enterica]|nr:hypothetical protein [Salmonella enterica subsp. enterica]
MGKLPILNGAISALVYDGIAPECIHISEIVDHKEKEITELHGGRGVIERCLNLETIKSDAYIIEKFKSIYIKNGLIYRLFRLHNPDYFIINI